VHWLTIKPGIDPFAHQQQLAPNMLFGIHFCVFNSSYPAASLLVLVPLETTVVLQLSLSLERRA